MNVAEIYDPIYKIVLYYLEALKLILCTFFTFNFSLSLINLKGESVIFILIVPLLLEFPRVIVKCVILAFDKFSRKEEKPVLKRTVKVSIVVPAHNEGEVIEDTINSLLDLSYPNKEIIIVDDNSTDNTYLKASQYARRGLIKLFRRREEESSKARALNYGFMFATGEIIVFIDADTRIQRESLEEILLPFEDPKVVAVAGNVRVLNDKNFLGKLQAYEYLVAMEMGRRFQSMFQLLLIIPGAFGAFRRRLLREVGMMDEDTITEDFDMVFKMKKTGGKLLFNCNAIAWTVVPISWRKWFRQRIRWARGELQTLIKHSDVIFQISYGVKNFLSVLDMVLTDIVFLYLRTAWFLVLPFILNGTPLWNIVIVLLIFYFLLEIIQSTTAIFVSPRGKREVKYLLLAPLVTFFYRPVYAIVRFIAYAEEILGIKAKW